MAFQNNTKTKKNNLEKVISNKIKIVIGEGQHYFYPLKIFGVIVVDEEHDASYKQDEGVIYNARDMAVSRANFEKIPIHLVTSVPSIETYNNIQNKKYRHIKIFKRFKDYCFTEN